MGNGIAHVFALHGYDVTLIDLDESLLKDARATIESNLSRQVNKEVITGDEKNAALGRLALTPSTEEGVQSADLVVEAVPEEQSSRPEQFIGMHFFNPVPVMTLVEVVRGQRTSDATFETVSAVAEDLGKNPVDVEDYPGFVSNRVLMPMINEAIFCVMEGVAEPEDIDTVMELGMNHPMGPLTLADFIGLDVCLHILEVLHDELGDDKYRPCPLLRRKVTAGQLGRKTGQGFFSYE